MKTVTIFFAFWLGRCSASGLQNATQMVTSGWQNATQMATSTPPDGCSSQTFDFAAWCGFPSAPECEIAYAALGLVLGTEAQRDGFPCPDGSTPVASYNEFKGVHKRKCCSCGGTFCPANTTFTNTTTTINTGIKIKTCKSVGDPHIYRFKGGSFDNHDVGWKTLYAKGNIMIQGNQMAFIRTGGVAVNGAVRYTTKAKGDLDAASTWQKPNGQTLENPPNATLIAKFADTGSVDAKLVDAQKVIIEFSDNFLTLQIRANDYRGMNFAATKMWYDIWVTTNDYAGATGQCTENGSGDIGPDDRPDGGPPSRRSLETSGGAAFPSDIKVTKAQAETACAAISDVDLRKDCVTDIRMVNNPSFVDKVVGGFKNVEAVDKAIAKTIADKTSTSTTPKVTTPPKVTTTAAVTTVDAAAGRAVTGWGLTALAIIRLLL